VVGLIERRWLKNRAWYESSQETGHVSTSKEERKMKYLKFAVIVVAILAVASSAVASPMPSEPTAKLQPAAPPAQAKQLVVYMQMGGTQGDASTLARTNGAKAAAADFGIKLVEQFSGWDP
jgi:hypothetical protein